MDPSGISNRDGNARRFTWGSIPRYFRDRPAEIRALLEAAGPNAAARGAFWYSLAWCVVMFLVYFWMSFVTGLFSVPDYVGGRLNLGDWRVLILTLPTMAALVVTMLTAVWTAALAVKGLFTAGESKIESARMLLLGMALVSFYGGVVSGLLGP